MENKPAFYDETMHFIDEFKKAKDVDEQGVVLQSWDIWKSVNGVQDEDWANLRFVVEYQAELLRVVQDCIDVSDSTISHLENVIADYKRLCKEKDGAMLRAKMYANYLEEKFLGRPGPSDFPES